MQTIIETTNTPDIGQKLLENFDEDTDVLEWWLVTPFMADMLKSNGEVILAAYDCYWWGRQTSGQGLSMDYVIQKIAEEMSV